MTPSQANDLAELVKQAQAIRDAWFPSPSDVEEIWYRGVSSNTHQLLPGTYRCECDERTLRVSFEKDAPTYVRRLPSNDWEWYYLSQHYGLPTRLLDWTRSLLTAAFFSVWRTCEDQTPSIWIMDAGTLNLLSTGNDHPYSPPSIVADIWLNCHEEATPVEFAHDGRAYNCRLPLAIVPGRFEPRLLAQQGMFTIHGKDRRPIEQVFAERSAGVADHLARIDLVPPASRWRRDLHNIGVRQATLFPDLASVARDILFDYDLWSATA